MIGSSGLFTAVDGLKKRVGLSGACAPPPKTRRRPGPIATTLLAAVGLRSLTAVSEIGLAAGEPPTAKGYTPSVFTLLAQLIERAGHFNGGSITAFYTVLMEGDDQQDPLVDAVRALLDGHVVLDRRLASQNHYPAISLLDSLSRLMPNVCSPEHMQKAGALRMLLAAYARAEDLVRIGAYQRGTDITLDKALAALPQIDKFLQQKPDESAPLTLTLEQLLALPS